MCLFNRDDTYLFTFLVDDPDFRCNDFFVNPVLRSFRGDMLTLQNSTAAARRLGFQSLGKLLDRQAAQVFTASRAHGHGSSFCFPIAGNQQIGNAFNRVLADFKADLLISQVRIDPQALIFQGFFHFSSIAGLLVRDIEDHGLYRGGE